MDWVRVAFIWGELVFLFFRTRPLHVRSWKSSSWLFPLFFPLSAYEPLSLTGLSSLTSQWLDNISILCFLSALRELLCSLLIRGSSWPSLSMESRWRMRDIIWIGLSSVLFLLFGMGLLPYESLWSLLVLRISFLLQTIVCLLSSGA